MFLGMKTSMNTNLTSIHHNLLLLIVLYSFIFILRATAQSTLEPKAPKNSVRAIFVFGDSTADPGNNNYIRTAFKSDFSPYGRDLPSHVATGRFSNGRLSTDFIASYVGIKELVPPYLNSSLSIEELMSGVSFASAGSGYDPLTPTLSGVIPMSKQLEYFMQYKSRIAASIGQEKTNELINKSVFIVSAGTNDFVVNYFTLPIRKRMYTIPQYQHFLVQNVHQFIKSLWDQGARKIAVVGIPPMGCLPIVITMASNNSITRRGCVESQSSVAKDYNQLLQTQLNSTQLSLQDQRTRIAYIDVYSPLFDMVQPSSNSNYSFEYVSNGCCGTGYLEAAFMCNPASYVCTDASKYVFWDSIHPTEITYYLIFKALRSVIDYIIKD
ncbi:GDSL esterase/lipase At5g45960-like [Chenopodium quinoa]|uniref:GDSL esterase/lipase At5g45960-like n=1 Tax=Chenopodium quinoa TaxID=63459 RepID=UPI000B7862BF|nr:GDSL esterase/lipase At5g45960-like [Chenopodium quinoa]